MNRLQHPISQGEYFGVFDAVSQASTDWLNLQSQDFKDSLTGSNLPAGLAFADLTVQAGQVAGLQADCYIKLRSRTAVNDVTTNEIKVLESSGFGIYCGGFKNGSVATIAYKKADAGQSLLFTCSFARATI